MRLNSRSWVIEFLLGITLICLQVSGASAAGFRLPNQDAYATSRGSAFVATADNASAVYYNPAGLGQLNQEEVRIGSYLINFGIEADIAGSEYSNNNKWQAAPQMFYANPGESFSWGFGIYAPFGLGNEWPSTTPFRTITEKAKIDYVTFSPVGSYQISDNLSLGFGLTYNYTKLDIRQGIGLAPDDRITLSARDTGIGYIASVLWQPHEKYSYGATYRSSASHEYEGTTNVSLAPGEMSTALELDIPDYLVVGYSYRPDARTNLEFNIEWGGWGKIGTPVLTDTALGDIPYPFEWDNGLIYEVGLSRTYGNYIYSIGYDYNEAVQTEQFYNPAVSDTDSHWLNLGIASEIDTFQWAISYQYGTSERSVDDAVTNLVGENANGTYRLNAHTFQFSLGLRF
jgi:long-chain fatty acid transport protein